MTNHRTQSRNTIISVHSQLHWNWKSLRKSPQYNPFFSLELTDYPNNRDHLNHVTVTCSDCITQPWLQVYNVITVHLLNEHIA